MQYKDCIIIILHLNAMILVLSVKNANVNATFAVKFKKSCYIEHDFKQSLSYQGDDDFHICAVDSM